MKQVYLSLLLAGLTAAPALGQKTTVNVFQFADLAKPDVEQTAWYNGRYKYAMAYDPVQKVVVR